MRTLVYLIALVLFMLMIWSRRLPGRSHADSPQSRIKGLEDFDEDSPDADSEVRGAFHEGVEQHLQGHREKARDRYQEVLRKEPENKTTQDNLRILEEE